MPNDEGWLQFDGLLLAVGTCRGSKAVVPWLQTAFITRQISSFYSPRAMLGSISGSDTVGTGHIEAILYPLLLRWCRGSS
jgi:hypothetical protein